MLVFLYFVLAGLVVGEAPVAFEVLEDLWRHVVEPHGQDHRIHVLSVGHAAEINELDLLNP